MDCITLQQFYRFWKCFWKCTSLWNILSEYGFEDNILTDIYTDNQSCVKHEGENNSCFHVGSGVRQGYVMSLLLFLLTMDRVMRCPPGYNTRIIGFEVDEIVNYKYLKTILTWHQYNKVKRQITKGNINYLKRLVFSLKDLNKNMFYNDCIFLKSICWYNNS